MLPYVTEENNYTNVSGYIGSIWNTLEETLEFKYVNCHFINWINQ